MNKSSWRVIPLARSLDQHAAPWDDLNGRTMGKHPLLDSRFIEPLLRHFGDGTEHLCLLERGGAIRAMAIVRPVRAGIWASFCPPLCPLGPTMLADGEGLSDLPRHLPGLAVRVDFLSRDPDYSPALDDWPQPLQRVAHALTISIRLEDSFDAYWQERSKKLRETMRGRANRLARAGITPRLACLETEDDIAAALERFGELEWSGWKGREGSALGRGNAQGNFYRDMMGAFAQAGQALAYEYWFDGRLAASQLAIANGRMIVALKIAYDESLAAFSPGRLLMKEFVGAAFSRMPGGVLEGYTDAGPELLAWATHQRWIDHVSLYRTSQARHFFSAVRAARGMARRLFVREPDSPPHPGRSPSPPPGAHAGRPPG